jgi:hypothetical protein
MELVEDDERVGCPKSTVADLLKNDSRIGSRMIAESLNIPKTVILQILKEDLEKRKLCARYVQHFLTPEEREGQVTTCQDITAMVDADKHFFNKIITRDETWCFAYDPEKKNRVLNGFMRHPLGQRNCTSKSPHQDNVHKFFRLSRRSAQIICTREKNSKCRIL